MILIVLGHLRWIDGAALAVWGIALLLMWTGCSRLTSAAHQAGHRRGWLPAPRHTPIPMKMSNEVVASGMAVLVALGTLAAFTVPTVAGIWGEEKAIRIAEVINPTAALFRVHVALALELYFLHKISLTPAYKMRWAVCWYIFCLVVAALK